MWDEDENNWEDASNNWEAALVVGAIALFSFVLALILNHRSTMLMKKRIEATSKLSTETL